MQQINHGLLVCTDKSRARPVEINDYSENGESKEQTIHLFKGDLVNRDVYHKNDFPILDEAAILAQWLPIADVKADRFLLYPDAIKNFIDDKG